MAAQSDVVPTVHGDPSQRRDAFYWRSLVQVASFAVFGVGALVVGAILLPLVRLAPAPRAAKRMRARAVMRIGLRFFVGFMHRLGGLTYEFRGVRRLGRPGQLIVANHPSLIDVVFLLAFVRGANCVVKHELLRNPLTRGAVKLAEYIANQPAAEMIETSAAALRSGETLIMFPEGTRTARDQPPVFHRGAASVALRAAQFVTPVYIHVEPTILTKADRWRRIPPHRPRIVLVVGEDLPLDAWRGRPAPLASRQLNDALHAQFRAELERLKAVGCRL